MKSFKWFLVVLVGVVMVGMPLMSAPASAKTYALTYSNFFPPTHFNGKLGDEFCKEIEKRTNGQVKITYFPGGSLLKGDAICDGVINGVTDIGMSCFAYTRGRFPVMEALDLPLGYTSGYVATMVANDYFAKFQPKELDNIKMLYIHAHGPGLLFTRDKAVRTLEDMKGMKIRATGFSSKVVTALGGAPVGMPQGGTYEALQKGVVDGTFGPIEVLKGWKQGEVIDYMTMCFSVGYTTAMYVAMNKAKWNSLPPDIQGIFTDVSQEWILKHAEGWDQADNEGKEFSLSLGNEIIDLSPAESQRWADAVAPVLEENIAELDKKGLPGREYIDYLKNIIVKYTNECAKK